MQVELTEDLCGLCVPGDVITVAGSLRAVEESVAKGRGMLRGQAKFATYLEAHSVMTHKLDDRENASYSATTNGAPSSQASVAMAGSGHHAGSGAGAAAVGGGSAGVSRSFSERERAIINSISRHRDALSLVLASCVPSIVGNETVKLGLLLGLFGGSKKQSDGHGTDVGTSAGTGASSSAASSAAAGAPIDLTDDHHHQPASSSSAPASAASSSSYAINNDLKAVAVRRDPHILVVGDPGLGKSQMLRAISALAPRGVYVSGQAATTAGLTATVVADPGSGGDHTLEAGALVLSDQGICAIDEFDKMKGEHAALLEAMEQQRVSIAKAGVVSSLHARASVLAAANPDGGHYNRSKTITENLKISPALLSRFDLIFILLDTKDQSRDIQLALHAMTNHGDGGAGDDDGYDGRGLGAGAGAGGEASKRARHADTSSYDDRPDYRTQEQHRRAAQFAQQKSSQFPSGASQRPIGVGVDGERLPILQRLQAGVMQIRPEELATASSLRKYVAFARRYCSPQLLPDAAIEIKKHYLSVRLKFKDTESTPITTRQLEALIRLSEARAKIELSPYVTVKHVQDVIDLLSESINGIAQTDDIGNLDFSTARMQGGMSEAALLKHIYNRLRAMRAGSSGREVWSRTDLEAWIKQQGFPAQCKQPRGANDLIAGLSQWQFIAQKGNLPGGVPLYRVTDP